MDRRRLPDEPKKSEGELRLIVYTRLGTESWTAIIKESFNFSGQFGNRYEGIFYGKRQEENGHSETSEECGLV